VYSSQESVNVHREINVPQNLYLIKYYKQCTLSQPCFVLTLQSCDAWWQCISVLVRDASIAKKLPFIQNVSCGLCL